MSLANPQYVSDLVVYLLHELGVSMPHTIQVPTRAGCMNRCDLWG
jgi:hypothetical protein